MAYHIKLNKFDNFFVEENPFYKQLGIFLGKENKYHKYKSQK
jgi:hypothetical protein